MGCKITKNEKYKANTNNNSILRKASSTSDTKKNSLVQTASNTTQTSTQRNSSPQVLLNQINIESDTKKQGDNNDDETLSNNKDDDENGNRLCEDEVTEDEIKLVRDSWKEMTKQGDFKKHGAIMMIRLVSRASFFRPFSLLILILFYEESSTNIPK